MEKKVLIIRILYIVNSIKSLPSSLSTWLGISLKNLNILTFTVEGEFAPPMVALHMLKREICSRNTTRENKLRRDLLLALGRPYKFETFMKTPNKLGEIVQQEENNQMPAGYVSIKKHPQQKLNSCLRTNIETFFYIKKY